MVLFFFLNTYLFFTYLFIWLHWVLVVTCGIFQLWLANCWLQHVGSSSLTRDQTWALALGVQSQPLDQHESPYLFNIVSCPVNNVSTSVFSSQNQRFIATCVNNKIYPTSQQKLFFFYLQKVNLYLNRRTFKRYQTFPLYFSEFYDIALMLFMLSFFHFSIFLSMLVTI